MSEFSSPLSQRDQWWIHLRERLAHAAREIHFVAIASDTENAPVLLRLAEALAGLALSIPMPPSEATIRRAAHPPTLFAAQVLSDRSQTVAALPSMTCNNSARHLDRERGLREG